ncbi:high mobility group protein B1-like [Mus pahari]|uniref:high mobility group protein B1-like n=1 Tax=Mus pahari TaxID=10093 RepID=UPI000A3132C8|nr:high mobility group protein B1-like [Mus pahari]
MGELRKAEGYLQAPIVKHRTGTLATAPSLCSTRWCARWSLEPAAKRQSQEACQPKSLLTCHTIYDKQGRRKRCPNRLVSALVENHINSNTPLPRRERQRRGKHNLDGHWATLCLAEENQLNTGKGDPRKPRGKVSSYAFFVQTCREEHRKKHRKKHPDAFVNFSEFSKKCSVRWKTMSAKEKGKFEDMAKADKVRYERQMKTYIPSKGETKKKFKDPSVPKRRPSAFLFCSEYHPKIIGEHPGLSIGDVAKKLGEMWNNTAADDKQLYEKKAAKLKEKYEKDIAAYRAKGKPDAVKKGVVKAEKSKKKKEEEDDEDDEEDEEEEEEDEDDE